jgi:hypothetical protein
MLRQFPSRTPRLLGVAAVAAALVLNTAVLLRGQEANNQIQKGRIGAEIHDTIAAHGIPIQSVRLQGDTYELVLGPNCSAVQAAEAEQIKTTILADAGHPIVVDNVTDALVVLRYEPENASANGLVRQRYLALKAAVRSGH